MSSAKCLNGDKKIYRNLSDSHDGIKPEYLRKYTGNPQDSSHPSAVYVCDF